MKIVPSLDSWSVDPEPFGAEILSFAFPYVEEESMPPTPLPSNGAVFLTGATGFLGMEILARYLERTDRPVYAAVRGRDAAEADDAAARRREVHVRGRELSRTACTRCPPTSSSRGSGLTQPTRDQLAERVTDIVHSRRLGFVHAAARRSRVRSTSRARGACWSSRELCRDRGGLSATRTSPPRTWPAPIAASSARSSSTSARTSATPTSSRSSRPSGWCARTPAAARSRSSGRASWSASARPAGPRRSTCSTRR